MPRHQKTIKTIKKSARFENFRGIGNISLPTVLFGNRFLLLLRESFLFAKSNLTEMMVVKQMNPLCNFIGFPSAFPSAISGESQTVHKFFLWLEFSLVLHTRE